MLTSRAKVSKGLPHNIKHIILPKVLNYDIAILVYISKMKFREIDIQDTSVRSLMKQ